MKKIVLLLIVLSSVLLLDAEVTESLLNTMVFRISIVGAVKEPGVYQVEPGCRLSEALQLADLQGTIPVRQKIMVPNAEIIEKRESKIEHSLRRIELHRNGEVIEVDLLRFLCCGELSSNPQLKDNDLIYVHALQRNLKIFGAVNAEGEYELLEGDRISDLIYFAQGLTEAARLDSATLVRIDYHTGKVKEYYFSPEQIILDEENPQNLKLESGDRIYIRQLPEYESLFNVYIEGNTRYPGIYAIEPGVTTLYEVLKKSGGANRFGDLMRAYLQRSSERDTSVINDPEYRRLSGRSFSELTELEREYLKFKNRELKGKIAVNFQELWESEGQKGDLTLEDNDRIYIPEKTTSVEISGAVLFPGVYKWVDGKNYEYYVGLAGGYTKRAQKSQIRIILGKSGAWLEKDKDRKIERGDKIFVPEKEIHNFWDITKETLTVMAQLATVMIAVINIYSN